MKFKKALVWSLVNNKPHRLLNEEEKKIAGSMGIVSTLFPGIDYYSISGFQEVLHQCVIPALKKLFPELQSTPEEDITAEMTIEIAGFLPSKKYEWQNSLRWRARFKKLLAAK